jgi:hypothetical protein
MTSASEPTRTPIRRVRLHRTRVAVLLVAVATTAMGVGGQLRASPSSVATSSSPARSALDEGRPQRRPPRTPGASGDAALGATDGAVPDGTTVFDDDVPGVAKLDRALLGALRRAAEAATADGVRLAVDSGWRSRAYQEQLLREAVSTYGSAAEAARWVATPDTSAHVSGDAVDVGPPRAAAWLARHGSRDGLCRIYANEPWHYELRPGAVDRGCPPTYADPTHDPRMQR